MWCCGKKNKSFHISKTLYNVINNFEDSTLNECIRMDTHNEEIYITLLKRAEKAHTHVKNSSIYITIEVPPPPRPSNRDRYNIWIKRSIEKPVIDQSDAVVFLISRGLKYDVDFEAYQAIELAKELKQQHNIQEPSVDKSKIFDNIFTQNDTNIIRKKSLSLLNNIGRDPNIGVHLDEYNHKPILKETNKVINIQTNTEYNSQSIASAPPYPDVYNF